MGNPKQKWSIEEEEALRAGVGRYGPGKWKMILADPEFSNVLASRSNVDLKDKWRNMGFSASGQGSRERVKTPKFKAHPRMSSPYSEIPSPLPAAQDASTSMAMDSEIPSPLPAAQDASTSMAMDPSMSPAYGKTNHRYTAMTFEALPTKKDLNESDINSVMRFIEIENCYKIKLDGVRGENTSVVEKQKDHQKQSQANAVKTIGDEIQETAKVAADMVGDAEYKKYMANVAGKTVDRVAKLAHDSDSLLQLVEHIFERCSNGEVVFMK